MTKYINLTTYLASSEQQGLGVIDVDSNVASALADLLSFKEPPKNGEMSERANMIADIAENLSSELGTDNVLINTKPFFLPTLVHALKLRGLYSYYTFAQRSMVISSGVIEGKSYSHKALVRCDPEE